MYKDKTLVCRDCGREFVFSAGEQEFYGEKGFDSEPSRCRDCRREHKQAQHRRREVFEIVCARCGKVDTVHFEPRHDRPVYCAQCHKEIY